MYDIKKFLLLKIYYKMKCYIKILSIITYYYFNIILIICEIDES